MPAEDVEALNDMETAMAAGGLEPWIDYNTRLNGCFLEKPSKAPIEEPLMRLKNLDLNECNGFDPRKWENNR